MRISFTYLCQRFWIFHIPMAEFLEGLHVEILLDYETLKKKYGMTQQGVSSGIDQLLAYGFIKITRHGGLPYHVKNFVGFLLTRMLYRTTSIIPR
jgi:hypothetical protein